MNAIEADPSPPIRGRIRTVVDWLLSLADEPNDDDDVRLRKRVGVLGGYILVILPLHLPFLAQGVPAAQATVVAGVIGQQRLLFDLWGNTVNIASRMESSGVPRRIHIAQSTRDLLPGSWSVEERESVEVKGMGRMTTYLVAADEAKPTR